MKSTKNTLVWLVLVSSFILQPSSFSQSPQIINYQGRLLDGTNLVNGTVGLSLRLFSASSGGSALYEDSNSVAVVDGLYSAFIGDHPTNMAFLVALTNPAVWVEVAVNGATLTPRERLASVGYALVTRGLAVATNDSVVINPTLNNTIHSATLRSVIGGGSDHNIGLSSAHAVVAGGLDNDIGADSDYGVIGGGANNDINSDAAAAVVAGGLENDIDSFSSYSSIGGGFDNDIGASSTNSVIAGGKLNRISSDVIAAVIGGGSENLILSGADSSTISGGFRNRIYTNALGCFIGGGRNHLILSHASDCVIGGGAVNNIGANSEHVVISGGSQNGIGANVLSGAIAGGSQNNLGDNSISSFVAGGSLNWVDDGANYAFAAGRRAKANHSGAFVWADSTNVDFASITNNQFNVRAIGGTRIVSGVNPGGAITSGVQLAAGSGSWSSLSDVNTKENFRVVDGRSILSRIAGMNISEWNYKTQDDTIRHIGPTAQDFRAAFGFGESATGISSVDADGVALAAIQALAKENAQLREELETIKRKLGM